MSYQFTPAQLAEEADRELKMRESVYPGQIARKKVSRDVARRRYAMMREIRDRLRDMVPPATPQPEQASMFGPPNAQQL